MSGYAATEAPTIAASSPEHPELEIAEDVVVIEIVDENGIAVPPGQPGAKVLLTNLINYAQPLIRYELTDSVVESPLPNPAGRPWRCLLSVDGRTADILYFPGLDGRRSRSIPRYSGRLSHPLPRSVSTPLCTTRRACMLRLCWLKPPPTSENGCAESLVAAVASTGAVPPEVFMCSR